MWLVDTLLVVAPVDCTCFVLDLVLLIDSRCPASLVIMSHKTETYFNCVVNSVFGLFHRVPWVDMQYVIVAFSTHTLEKKTTTFDCNPDSIKRLQM